MKPDEETSSLARENMTVIYSTCGNPHIHAHINLHAGIKARVPVGIAVNHHIHSEIAVISRATQERREYITQVLTYIFYYLKRDMQRKDFLQFDIRGHQIT